MIKMIRKELNSLKIKNSFFKRKKDQRNREISIQNTHQFIKSILQLIYSKSKISDPKPFIGKREEYKSWKWNINNKFIWELERFNTNKY